MKTMLPLLLLLSASLATRAQSVGIGTAAPAASAALEVSSTSKGLLLPRLTDAQMRAIASPQFGLLVYNTTDYRFYGYKAIGIAAQNAANATTPGIGDPGSGTGQSFTSTLTTNLGTITVYLGRSIGGTGTMSLTMFSGAGIGGTNLGTNLGTISRSVTMTSSPSAITFDFNALNIPLTSGQVYTFSLTSASFPGTLSVAITNYDSYGGGQYYFGNSGFSFYDSQFQVTAASGEWAPLN
ncbi:hypothetical protein Q5H93_22560 [Hymenobacter sp. ASUV-10]|uniref:Uncharacterized protein n=1 Tax=Hymenobacter aranciens TaxID=3063996 RepID=A0ABT9BIN5_9BACT|nr:hypothetical protein [Hymenobacter sp. ASUV-10]MDO7877538.1 hypothetical protein [Hymenobacter sp. ASUV-10]